MNRLTSRLLITAAIALPTVGSVLLPAYAQPGSGNPPREGGRPEGRPNREGGGPSQRGGQRSEWAEKYREEMRDHPRMGRAIVALHEVKDYMERATIDFGGNKAKTITAIDESLKQLKEAIKHDPKRERREGGEDGPGGERPAPKQDKKP